MSSVHAGVGQYVKYGNLRPPETILEGVYNQVTGGRKSPLANIVGAHACLDLAVHRNGPKIQFERAKKLLDKVVEMHGRPTGLSKGGRAHLTSAAGLATFYKALLPDWRNATRGFPVQPNYETLLEAAQTALKFIEYETHPTRVSEAESTIIETTPLLLGARKTYREGVGWVGRLALWREDHSHNARPGFNPNWDVGICFPGDTTSFIDPLKVQVQKSHTNDIMAAQAAGVHLISAKHNGFSDPYQIVLSCLNEFEPVRAPDWVTLLASEQLDAVANDIESNLKVPLPPLELPKEN